MFCEFSFPRSIRVNADVAVNLYVKCLERCAKKTGVEFKVFTTGNLSRTDKQIHFHTAVLPINADEKSIQRLKNALQSRWAYVANRRHHPTASTLRQGYSLVSTQDEYCSRLVVDEFPELTGDTFQGSAFKWAYNLNLEENGWLFNEDRRLGIDKIYSKKKKHHKYL